MCWTTLGIFEVWQCLLQDKKKFIIFTGKTCLHIAASQGHLEVVKQLLNLGADVNAREDLGGMTALHLALERNQKEVIWLLLNERKLCVATRNYAGLTCYDLAKELNQQSTLLLMVHRNFDEDKDFEVESEFTNFARQRHLSTWNLFFIHVS